MSIIQSKTALNGKFTANVEFFDSTMECVRTCKERTITDSSFDDTSRKSMSKSWEGVRNYEEALQIMNDGWSEEVHELQAITEKCKQLQTDKRITFKNDVCGFSPIVPLALQGVPQSMINSNYKPIKSKVVSIYYDLTISCGNDADQITKNGKKMVEAIIKLENMGYRINLNIVQTYTASKDSDILVIKVKSANQHLDLKRICFPTMHSAMFRVIGFDWYSKFPRGKYRSGYGHAVTYELQDKELTQWTKDMFGDDAIYIAGKLIQDKDVDYLIKVLKEGRYEQK